eukprot:TRINITY_DN45095_c0_g1_i1.p1 TRINITY_DN45095_c0_g1~~TRINITY_DN45095_c0_g1_i1.p1  ORF type:complete len:259 (-),score=36.80 TRINITY_DN45095_c0_g1_i1:248-1024(-)
MPIMHKRLSGSALVWIAFFIAVSLLLLDELKSCFLHVDAATKLCALGIRHHVRLGNSCSFPKPLSHTARWSFINSHPVGNACLEMKSARRSEGCSGGQIVDWPGQIRTGDWVCPGCSRMQFAKRYTCRCGALKPADFKQAMKSRNWICTSCKELNYDRNTECHKCKATKPSSGEAVAGVVVQQAPRRIKIRTGDWVCPECLKVGFASKDKCSCGAAKPRDFKQAMRSGDWICASCQELNYDRKTECYKCKAAQPSNPS